MGGIDIMADAVEITYEVHLQSPMHCGSGYKRGLLDRAVVRNGRGDLYIPGSTIKGKTRHTAEQIAVTLGLRSPHFSHRPDYRGCRGPAMCDVCRLFGSPSTGEKLFFSDATIHEEIAPVFHVPARGKPRPVHQTWQRTHAALNRRTGTAAEGRLFASELAVPLLVFRGTINGTIESSCANPGVSPLRLLLASLWTIRSLGSDGTRGVGRCSIDVSSLIRNGTPVSDPKGWLVSG
jgi:CRISPR/Cas system CSM-associated protein Csm3 (group 7 of RAMP superfamily)